MIEEGPHVRHERFASRAWDADNGFRRVYAVFNAPTEQVARSVTASSPLVPETIDVPAGFTTKRRIVKANEKGHGEWVMEVEWEEVPELEPPDPDGDPGEDRTLHIDSFEIRASSRQVYAGETVGTYAAAGVTAPDFGGAINVDIHRNVAGVAWPPADAQLIARTREDIPAASVTEAYYRSLTRIVSRVNAAAYMGFEPEELLFLGASGSRTVRDPSSPWKITYRFAASTEEQDVKIGDGITIPTKKGWHYAWPWFGETLDPQAGALVARPLAAYVVRIGTLQSFEGLIL